MIINKFNELEILNKELEPLYNLWNKTNSTLNNSKFMEKAPIDIKEKELQKWKDSLNAIIAVENRIYTLLFKEL